MSRPEAVLVETPARLHFGMLDLGGRLGRRFGGIGAALPVPRLRLWASRARETSAEGPDRLRAERFAREALAAAGVAGGVRLTVHEALPAHAGLGSGTQLGLAVARAVAALHDLPADIGTLARLSGRGHRSAIGLHVFAGGGFILEGGRRDGGGPAPLLARLPMPASWHAVLAIPAGGEGLSGPEESQAFRTLPDPPTGDVEAVAHQVLMRLLPALVEGDLAACGAAIEAVQAANGRWFAPVQGGPFAGGATARLVEGLRAAGGLGVGQSSWGPSVYALAGDAAAAARLAAVARDLLGGEGRVVSSTFDNSGARVTPLSESVVPD